MNRFPILLKREFWEHRGGFLWAPVWTAGVFALLILMGLATAMWHTSGRFNGEFHVGVPLKKLLEKGLGPEELSRLGMGLDGAMAGLWTVLQVVLFFVIFFYLLGALYDERRDRSVLFWKSLPVSDLETVLSKVATAAVVAPVIAFVAAIALQLAFLLLLSGFALIHGASPMQLIWGPARPLALWGNMALTIPITALWALPTFGWLLLTSAFARSKPFLWAVALPAALGVIVMWFDVLETLRIPDTWYWSHVFARLVGGFLPGSWAFRDGKGLGVEFEDDRLEIAGLDNLGALLTDADTWIGAALGIAMIAAAVYLRRRRELAD
jgi:ABC-2 type transport system permease protein